MTKGSHTTHEGLAWAGVALWLWFVLVLFGRLFV